MAPSSAFGLDVSGAALLMIEQINLTPNHTLLRPAQVALLSRVEPAMLIARERNLPTLNGYSGWFPKGWDLLNFDAGYSERARAWADTHELSSGLCELDLVSGSWSTRHEAGYHPISETPHREPR